MVTTWQPQWVPAVVLGMEKRTLASLLSVVLLVGFFGSCMGVSSQRMLESALTTPAPVAPLSRVSAEEARAPRTTPPAPAPQVRPEERLLPAAPTAVHREPPAPAVAPGPAFEVEASDVRDPWAP